MVNVEALYRRYAGDVYRFACWLGNEPAEAEDIVSETFLLAWTSDQPLRVATVKGYLFTIARHVYLKRLQRAKRYAPMDAAPQGQTDAAPGPDVRAEQSDELAAAMKAMQALSEVERSALLLRAQHDLPYDEIARSPNISFSLAKVTVHRARVKLAAYRAAPDGRRFP